MTATAARPIRIVCPGDFKAILFKFRTDRGKPVGSADRQLARKWELFCAQPRVVELATHGLSPWSSIYGFSSDGVEPDRKIKDFHSWLEDNTGAGKLVERAVAYHYDWWNSLDKVRAKEFTGWPHNLAATDLSAKKKCYSDILKRVQARYDAEEIRGRRDDDDDKVLLPEEARRILDRVSRSADMKDLWMGSALTYSLYTGMRAVEVFSLRLASVHRLDPVKKRHALDPLTGPDKLSACALTFVHRKRKGSADCRFKNTVFEHRDPSLCALFMLAMYVLVRSAEDPGWHKRHHRPLLFEALASGRRETDDLRKEMGKRLHAAMTGVGLGKSFSTHLGHSTVLVYGKEIGISGNELAEIVRHNSSITNYYSSAGLNQLVGRAKLCGHTHTGIVCERARVPERVSPSELTRWVEDRLPLQCPELRRALAGVLLSGLPHWPVDSFGGFHVVTQLRQHPAYQAHSAQVLHHLYEPLSPGTQPQTAPVRSSAPRPIPADFKVSVRSFHEVGKLLDRYQQEFGGTLRQHMARQQIEKLPRIDWEKGPGLKQWNGWQRFAFEHYRATEKCAPLTTADVGEMLDAKCKEKGVGMKAACMSIKAGSF